MNIITRHMPDAIKPFMRFQIGFMETRPFKFPLHDGKRLLGYRSGPETVQSFHLLGHGSTLKRAERMAKVKAGKEMLEYDAEFHHWMNSDVVSNPVEKEVEPQSKTQINRLFV